MATPVFLRSFTKPKTYGEAIGNILRVYLTKFIKKAGKPDNDYKFSIFIQNSSYFGIALYCKLNLQQIIFRIYLFLIKICFELNEYNSLTHKILRIFEIDAYIVVI